MWTGISYGRGGPRVYAAGRLNFVPLIVLVAIIAGIVWLVANPGVVLFFIVAIAAMALIGIGTDRLMVALIVRLKVRRNLKDR